MKLLINIPCLNEEESLPAVLAEIPERIEGIDAIEVQVVDDGSTDATAEIARQHGCLVIRHKRNRGLGSAFQTGMANALARGADIIVNTDGDNQYPARFIPDLVRPILENQADIVIGNRTPWTVKHFGLTKRVLQFIGNAITRQIAGVKTPDMVSGFRAYSREAVLRLSPIARYSYTLDTIVQAAKKGLVIASVPIETNPPTRRSRLFRNSWQFVLTSTAVILRVVVVYEPFKTFLIAALTLAAPGIFLLIRFLRFYLMGDSAGHVQSLILAAILIIVAGLLFALGLLADLTGMNRRLLEEELYLLKKNLHGPDSQS